jgi:hypothetical protein
MDLIASEMNNGLFSKTGSAAQRELSLLNIIRFLINICLLRVNIEDTIRAWLDSRARRKNEYRELHGYNRWRPFQRINDELAFLSNFILLYLTTY